MNVFKQQMKLYEQVENFQMMYKVMHTCVLDWTTDSEHSIISIVRCVTSYVEWYAKNKRKKLIIKMLRLLDVAGEQ